jgi:hypothetical protein
MKALSPGTSGRPNDVATETGMNGKSPLITVGKPIKPELGINKLGNGESG